MLRKHQQELRQHAIDMRAGINRATNILAHVTPGGGKSALPMILAKELAEPLGYKICWVVPRDALRSQGERGFVSLDMRNLIGHKSQIRASGNDARPARGTIGYITTYQAIAAHPQLHEQEFQLHKYILVLDECHHVPLVGDDDEAKYYDATRPLVQQAMIRLFMSGTLERHDKKRIAYLPYKRSGDGQIVDTSPQPDWQFIQYLRGPALEEHAILPLHFQIKDGLARWLNPLTGEEQKVDSIAESSDREQPAILRTILSTEYAFALLDRCLSHWQDHRRYVYPLGKMLVVAPGIDVAKKYYDYIKEQGYQALIATSDDSPQAKQNIKRFKGISASKSTDILITVGMAYEGLDVPAISHVAVLTNIRSRPWIEQCICRANRVDDENGKTHGFLFVPDDPRMKSILSQIEFEQMAVVPGTPWTRPERVVGPTGEIKFAEPIDSAMTRGRAQGNEDGLRTDYNETALIESAMDEAHIKGISVIQFKQAMAYIGAGVIPNSMQKPNYERADVLTPSEVERKLKASIDNIVKRISHGDKDRIVELNKELKGMFGERGALTSEMLQMEVRYLNSKYGHLL